jgi:hypothetical protein
VSVAVRPTSLLDFDPGELERESDKSFRRLRLFGGRYFYAYHTRLVTAEEATNAKDREVRF